MVSGGAAQPTRTVGVLLSGSAGTFITRQGNAALEQGLRDRGWIPGETIRLEYRYADGDSQRLSSLASELVKLPVDVIVGRGLAACQAAAKATTTIPVVMSAAGVDPVRLGLVASLSRPGRNVTGLSLVVSELEGKRLQLLKEVVPGLRTAGFLAASRSPSHPAVMKEIETAAGALNVRMTVADVREPGDIEPAFATFVKAGIQGLVVQADAIVLENFQPRIIALALKHRWPVVYPWANYVEQGGLMSYSSSLTETHYRAAGYVDRILKGARPADLPVEQPQKFELVVNLKSAQAIGLTIHQALQLRADRVLP
jgi:putative ABC transport system substrate-binding protein